MRRIVMAVLTVVIGTMFGLLVSTTAHADSGPQPASAAGTTSAAEKTIKGVLKVSNEPVAGVTISVAGEGGAEIAKTVTDDKGAWSLKVPGAGTYSVSLDAASLPEGVTISEKSVNPREIVIRETGSVPAANFILVPAGGAVAQESDSVVFQYIFNGLRFGLILALASIGLSMIFGTTGFSNFAHGELLTFGAIMAYIFNVTIGMNIYLASLLALIVCGAVAGYGQDRLLWGPLRKRGTGVVAMMIISIGLAMAARYLYLLFFGDRTENYSLVTPRAIDLGILSVNPKDLWIMLICAVVLTGTLLLLTKTRMGKATRAVSDNPALASASGIDVDGVIRLVWVVGAILAGLAGILYSSREGVVWDMGFGKGLLLLMFASVVLGGLGTSGGAIAGAMIIGLLVELSPLVIDDSIKTVGALAVMIIILLVRPDGLFGRKERIG